MTEKQNNDQRLRYRDRSSGYTPSFYRYGNDGPGKVAKVDKFSKRTRMCLYKWQRRRQMYRRWDSDVKEWINTKIEVPVKELFNISEYKLGDYKQFFNDPRTRQNYLQWAHMLLTAEEYVSGNIKLDVKRRAEPVVADEEE